MPTPREIRLRSFVDNFPNMDPTSYLYPDSITPLPRLPAHLRQQKLYTLVAVCDPIDQVKKWQDRNFGPDAPAECLDNFPLTLGDPPITSQIGAGIEAPSVYRKSIIDGGKTKRILLLNTAYHFKPGGGFEGRVLTQEEDFSRRTNLVKALESTDPASGMVSYYPLEVIGGIYSPNVVIYKEGFDGGYETWPRNEWTAVSVVSVPPVRNPRLDESGKYYSSDADRALQYEKMKTILRIAALNGHVNLALTGFGSIDTYPFVGQPKNPVVEVAFMWKKLLLEEEEFKGWFELVQFVFNGVGSWKNDPVGSDIAREEFRKYFGTECGNIRTHDIGPR